MEIDRLDRLIALVEHEANSHGKLDYKHQVVVALKEYSAISRKLAEAETKRDELKDVLRRIANYANSIMNET